MADFSELLITRRSVRDYEDREVPLSVIREIIQDSCFAPSASNRQPWRFIVINNKEWMGKLSRESKANLLDDLEKNPPSFLKKYEPILRDEGFNVFYNAPCLVYITGSREIGSLDLDCALAASYFMLSAASRGLGTCWVALGSRIKDPEIMRDIGLTEDCRIVVPIILGYPRNIPEPPERPGPEILKVIQ